MNKSQLVDALAARFEGNRKAASHALESVLDTITREVAKGEKVAITGFGSFEKRVRAAGYARNPATGERIRTKKKAIPKFTPGQDLKNVISGAKKLPKLTIAAAAGAAAGEEGGAGEEGQHREGRTGQEGAGEEGQHCQGRTGQEGAGEEGQHRQEAPAKKAPAKKAPAAKKARPRRPAPRRPRPPRRRRRRRHRRKKAPAKKAPAKKAPAKKS